jgi:hypothetical protein
METETFWKLVLTPQREVTPEEIRSFCKELESLMLASPAVVRRGSVKMLAMKAMRLVKED